MVKKRQPMQRLTMSQHCQARGTGDISHLETDGGLARIFYGEFRFADPAVLTAHVHLIVIDS